MEFSSFDHECMALALRLARKGLYSTHPNPRVGCVISRSGHIVGTGWHVAAGSAHAEVNALEEAGDQARASTAYVTLEPCAHQGQTSACAEALVRAGVSRVVAAVSDPNPRVNGQGYDCLREAGVQVDTGLMETQARELNCGFFSRIERGRPWVRVKSAQSLDGRTALENGESRWISSEESRRDVQRWRARSDAILTGSATVRADDPRMTTRFEGATRQPLRVIAASRFAINTDAQVLKSPGDALVVGCEAGEGLETLLSMGIECLVVENDGAGRVSLKALLSALAERSINEVQVEAGSVLCGALLREGLVDEVLLYQAPCLLGAGAAPAFAVGPLESMADRMHFECHETVRTGPDWRFRLKPKGAG
ncbi:MAG: bifunctional diaminohydroxyphosphoribosylaminopyrimidine deaminase/5-amino-6-(5-phosphoribosylamino)uracil reductase RibD [Xanthomonadales bacterium]|nr:bifunctional diaminohydroxyphosphoribosylaminopyrimidine deaminase/5-amino-6-(5-phosphoribosylamino)uracil reductase RibD [Xanthomonadales bacterium]